MAENHELSKEANDKLKDRISEKARLLDRLYNGADKNPDEIEVEKKIAVVEQILEHLNDKMADHHHALYERAVADKDAGEVEHHIAHYLGYEALARKHGERHHEALERIREIEADRG